MAFRVHLAAHLTRFSGPDPELGEPHQVFALDGWAGALLSVWGGSVVDLDWRLAKISRRLGTLALRATTEDDCLFQLVLLINGERAVRLAHVYFEGLDEGLEMLQDHLEIEALEPDAPVAEDLRPQVLEMAHEEAAHPWLVRVAAGEPPRQAFLAAGRLQAAEVAAAAEAAELPCDVELLERFFTGGLTPEEVEAESDWENFGDLLLLVEALGLRGLKQHLEARAESEEQLAEPEGPEEELEEAPADDRRTAGKRRRPGKRALGAGCLLAIAGVAGLVWLGAEMAGGMGAAGAVLLLVLLLALGGRWLWRRFTRRLEKAFGGDTLETPDVPPAQLQKWRTLLFNWRDLIFRLGVAGSGRRPKLGLFDALYADRGIPTDPAGERLIELMREDEAALSQIAAKVRDLRLALLDAEIAGTDAEPQRAAYRKLCERLLRDSS